MSPEVALFRDAVSLVNAPALPKTFDLFRSRGYLPSPSDRRLLRCRKRLGDFISLSKRTLSPVTTSRCFGLDIGESHHHEGVVVASSSKCGPSTWSRLSTEKPEPYIYRCPA